MAKIRLRDIEMVRAVMQEKNFSRAAEKLYISQPALSQAIKRLEQEYHIVLFTRGSNSTNLTSAGQLFLEYGENVLHAHEILENKMSQLSSEHEECLSIGVSQFYGCHHLSRFLPVFQARCPSVTIRILEGRSDQLEELVISEKAELALVPLPLLHGNLEYKIVNMEEIYMAVPPNHFLAIRAAMKPFASPYIELSAVKDETFVFLSPEMRFTQMATDACKKAGFEPNIAYETHNWDTVYNFIKNGLGLGFLPEVLRPHEKGPDQPVFFHLYPDRLVRPYAVCYRKGSLLSLGARQFIQVISKLFQEEQ